MPALAMWTPEDGLLGALAPLGAALAAPPALVIDLDPSGPAYPGERSLADLVADEPTLEDLTPRSGVAVVRNGGIAPSEAAGVGALFCLLLMMAIYRLVRPAELWRIMRDAMREAVMILSGPD